MKNLGFSPNIENTKSKLIINPPEQSSSTNTNGQANKMSLKDRAFHDWYRFVLSYPPHLVENYIEDFELHPGQVILDPFCGTGTTLVEAKLHNISAVGLESNPFPHFASSVKVDWSVDPDALLSWARRIADTAIEILNSQGIEDNEPFKGDIGQFPLRQLDHDTMELLITNSISPIPLHKTLILLNSINQHKGECFYKYGLLALGNALVFSISNLRFGPEVGIGKIKKDSPVIIFWLSEITKMANDLNKVFKTEYPHVDVYLADSRHVSRIIQPKSIDSVITSPPYPNEKDYTRTTRLESAVLGFINTNEELRFYKKQLLRSNTRSVYKGDCDDLWIATYPDVQSIANEIEQRRIEMGKTSGFEKLYGKVTKLYFGGMLRHLADLRIVLKPGAKLAYVVGDQSSYLRVMIRTGQLLSGIAKNLGYEVLRTDLFRTRFSTATKDQLREEVVILKWHG